MHWNGSLRLAERVRRHPAACPLNNALTSRDLSIGMSTRRYTESENVYLSGRAAAWHEARFGSLTRRGGVTVGAALPPRPTPRGVLTDASLRRAGQLALRRHEVAVESVQDPSRVLPEFQHPCSNGRAHVFAAAP